jgi:hypothetical protein
MQYVEVDGSVLETIRRLAEARLNERGWARIKDESSTMLHEVLGEADGMVHDGAVVLTVQTRKGRRSVDLTKLAALYPEAYADCVSAGAPQRVLQPKV